MSQYMNTTAGPLGDVAPPSNNRWWAIAAGIGLAAVLGYGAALVATDHLPGAGHPVAAPVEAVATPQAQSNAASDDLATRSAVQAPAQSNAASDDLATRSAVQAPAQSNAASDDLATRSAVQAPAQSNAASDDLATRSAVQAPAQSNAASDDLATRSAVISSASVAQSALDPFELRLVSPETQIAGSMSQPTVGYVDGQWHTVEAPKYPTLEFR